MVDEREVLELLSSAARAGSVAAMKEMRVYWRERPEPDRAGDILDELDEVAALRELGDGWLGARAPRTRPAACSSLSSPAEVSSSLRWGGGHAPRAHLGVYLAHGGSAPVWPPARAARASGSPNSSYPPDWRSQVEKRQRRAMPQYLRPRRGESGSPSRSLSSSVSTSPRDSDWLWATLCQRALSARQLPATSMSARGKQRSSLTI
jgi:hypothetical protein